MTSTRVVFLSAWAGIALAMVGCTSSFDSTDGPTSDVVAHHAPPPSLVPPAPYVLAHDGVTHLSLEQAHILAPDGDRWAVVLGKALFWDEQVGSTGNACASCHFDAGSDLRLRNQLNPGANDITFGPGGDTSFGSTRSDTGAVLPGHMPSGAVAGPNYKLTSGDLPFHHLSDESNRNSPLVTTTNDRSGPQGTFAAQFEHVGHGGGDDACGPADASEYHVGPYAARQVEPRQSSSFIDAAFNPRNFWDNRANNLFNGVGVFGLRDVVGDPSNPDDPRNNNRLVIADHGQPTLGYLQVEDASLASQSEAPPVSAVEMSCAGRTFPELGRKLLSTIPLRRQKVSHHDSVLGPFVSPSGHGLRISDSYAQLIMRTFDPKYWALPGRYRIEHGRLIRDPHGYTQMELNFSMFWGIAIMEYERTQISDRSEFDELQASGRLAMTPSFIPGAGGCQSPTGDVDPLLVRGCTIFARFNPSPFIPTPPDGIRGGNCFVCHDAPGGGVGLASQPMLTEVAVPAGASAPLFLEVTDIHNVQDLRDNGASNIGLRDVVSDLLSGGKDPYGNPLSFGRQYWNYLHGQPDAILDPELQRLVDSGGAPTLVGPQDPPGPSTFVKLEDDGAAKVPILRNVALTPPYFNWGGYPSLRQVLKVYNRGMNRRDITGAGGPDAHGSSCTRGDDTGTGPDGNQVWPIQGDDCGTNTTGVIVPLGLSDCDANGEPNAACLARGQTVEDDDLAAVVRFLESLTDHRVQCDEAPFDHPELHVRDGHFAHDFDHDGEADDRVFDLPAVGAEGFSPASGLCIPNAGNLFAPGMQARNGGDEAPLD
jgi:hypothetical protein